MELSNFYKNEQTLSSAQRKKLKKKQKQYEEQLQLDEQISKQIEVGNDEFKLMEEKLNELGLTIYNIQPDGNCLFKSIEHQLKHHRLHGELVEDLDYHELRKLTVQYLRNHKNQYKYFISKLDPNAQLDLDSPMRNGDSETNVDDIDHELDLLCDGYCSNMERDGEWGSELEVLILTKILNCKIVIFNNTNNQFNHLQYGTNDALTLNISYHKFQYILGPHYNSIVPKSS